jgi:hypothetical protein
VQECRKRFVGRCTLCGSRDFASLDAHRILPGSEGGRYQWANLLVLCANCHRLVHAGQIEILGRYLSTSGRHHIHYRQDGIENWVVEPSFLDEDT